MYKPSVSPDPERHLVTVLLTDVVESTPIAERLGPERYETLFDETARITREQVERFGGTVPASPRSTTRAYAERWHTRSTESDLPTQ